MSACKWLDLENTRILIGYAQEPPQILVQCVVETNIGLVLCSLNTVRVL
jgi:hypothetical protein